MPFLTIYSQLLTFRYLQKIRLKHAYYDLIHTNMKINDIALNHGFKNVKSFENVFKKEYHTTPSLLLS